MNINLSSAETGVDLPLGSTIEYKDAHYLCMSYDTIRHLPHTRCEDCAMLRIYCGDLICDGRLRHDDTYVYWLKVGKEGGEQ